MKKFRDGWHYFWNAAEPGSFWFLCGFLAALMVLKIVVDLIYAILFWTAGKV